MFPALEYFLLAHSLNRHMGCDCYLREITANMRAILELLGTRDIQPAFQAVVDQSRQHFKAPPKS